MDKKINIKWNKDIFTVYVRSAKSVKDFKKNIFEMTGINERDQKLIKSGWVLGDSESIQFYEDGCLITMITSSGFKSEIIKEEQKETEVRHSEPIFTELPKAEPMGYNYTRADHMEKGRGSDEINRNSFFRRFCTKFNIGITAGICCIFMFIIITLIIKK